MKTIYLILYNLAIEGYVAGAKISALKNEKARLFLKGRKNWEQRLKKKIDRSKKYTWFHFSSLGEFEQGRPLLEKIKADYAQKAIIITFFSPSGYEIRKNYELADIIEYLPMDSKKNARKFLDIINPEMAVFVKYDLWYYFLKMLSDRDVPTFLISGLFKTGQAYFKWYGGLFRKMLQFFTHIFVQDESSLELLSNINFKNVTVTGDTRVDRAAKLPEQIENFQLVKQFIKDHTIIIGGSTYEKEEKWLLEFFKKYKDLNIKMILVPHNVGADHISEIINMVPNYTLFSDLNYHSISHRIMIVDKIGILASLYSYADIAVIGGGFGKGIHNTLEPAAFGLPILFGPQYQKFNEAIKMVGKGGAFEFNSYESLEKKLLELLKNTEIKKIGKLNKDFIESQMGGTEKIFNYLKTYLEKI